MYEFETMKCPFNSFNSILSYQKATKGTGDVTRRENVCLAHTEPCLAPDPQNHAERAEVFYCVHSSNTDTSGSTNNRAALLLPQLKGARKTVALKLPTTPDFSTLL